MLLKIICCRSVKIKWNLIWDISRFYQDCSEQKRLGTISRWHLRKHLL